MSDSKGDFYCRYYVGHKGKFGHEFLEFEFTASGLVQSRLLDRFPRLYTTHITQIHMQMRYANNSNYKNDTMIRKEVQVSKTVLAELRRILVDSEVQI